MKVNESTCCRLADVFPLKGRKGRKVTYSMSALSFHQSNGCNGGAMPANHAAKIQRDPEITNNTKEV